ncbi:leucine-rich repeat domain-containing protein [Treponema sp. R6D11]
MKKRIIVILLVLFLTGNVFGQGLGFQAMEDGGKITITGYVGKEKYLTIPGTANGMPIVAIAKEAFRGKGLISITIPDSVTAIGDSAFAGNELIRANIGNGVTTIGERAFSNNKLTSIVIPNSVTVIGESAFFGNQLTSVTIGNSVTTIGNFAFSESQITSLTLPNSVINVGEKAFSGGKLTSITIGPNVKLNRESFPDSFINTYNNVAGTYTRPSISSTTWTRGLITF